MWCSEGAKRCCALFQYAPSLGYGLAMIWRRNSLTIQTFSHESHGILLFPLLLILIHRAVVWTSSKSQDTFVNLLFLFAWTTIPLHYGLRQNILPKVQTFCHRRKKISSLSSSSWQRQTLTLFSFGVPLFHPCATTFSDIILQRSVVGHNSFKRDWDLLHVEGLDVRTTGYTVTLILLISALRCFMMC